MIIPMIVFRLRVTKKKGQWTLKITLTSLIT